MRVSKLIHATLRMDVSCIPAGGAAGGLGAGAVAFMNAKIVSGIDTIMNVSQMQLV
jgi:glycerate kinase